MLTLEDAWRIALKIHALAELGSREYESSKLLAQTLESEGFETALGYLGIPTAFRAEKKLGVGPTVAFLAEYDALPRVGHACGYNMIAAAVYSAVKAASPLRAGRIVVIGTPDEEGTGGWCGSKIILAKGEPSQTSCSRSIQETLGVWAPPRSQCRTWRSRFKVWRHTRLLRPRRV